MNDIKNFINKGDVISSSLWPEPVEVKLIEEKGAYIHIIGNTTKSNSSIDQLLSEDNLLKLKILGTNNFLNEESWKVFLAIENLRYKYASLFDPLLAVNTSKIDPLPHQIEAVYGYILKIPRIRFLIADDPGAGKTIMAGLILKELKLRKLINRILIVCPGHLKDQWTRELNEKFKENFITIERSILNNTYGENLWLRENKIITSMDFIKQDEIISSLSAVNFDIIIVDEAHKMSAYMYGDKIDKTARYKLGEILSNITEHLIFLTATPHKGDPENFRLFLDLLEPGAFATQELINQSIQNKDNPLFIRRIKEDLKDFDGKPLFLPRNVITKTFNLGTQSPQEKELYNELSRYVETQYNLALSKDKKRNIAFALVILQRRMASSIYALLKSLERRRKRLSDLINETEQKTIIDKIIDTGNFNYEDIEELSETERWKQEEVWETLSVAENKEELKKEIATLDILIEHAKNIIENEEEIKLRQLKNSLKELEEKFNQPKDKKIIIFTESKDTLDYLEKKLKQWGYLVNVIHGGMSLEERVTAEKIFKNETQILVATEAAGEGINLQFCHLMVNYDIPWNPNRLEQRMGRIHRYGQDKEVFIFNLVAEDTREGKVLNKLFQKLDEIKKALGSDKVFDCLGEVMLHENLSQLLIDAASNARNIDDILKEIDIKVDEEYISKVKENLGESLATHFIDYTRIKEMQNKAKENRLIPEYTEAFFKKAFIKAGGKIKELEEKFISVEQIPVEIRNITNSDIFEKNFGTLLIKYPKVTFDKEIAFKNQDAEFISFGHSLFEALMQWIEQSFSSCLYNGATFIDPDGIKDGYIVFYEGEIKDGFLKVVGKRLFSYYIPANDNLTPIAVSPSVIWDLAETTQTIKDIVDIKLIKEKTENLAIGSLETYKEELLKERIRQAQIKQKYGLKSLEHLILKLDNELIKLYDRRQNGEKVDIAIINKEERKKIYDLRIKALEQEIEAEQNLTISTPKFLGIIKVIPEKNLTDYMQTDEEIENIGMKIAIEYEKKNERQPEDVSDKNLGFDIRSTDKFGNIRYIEVKARNNIGSISLTQNEWFKANRFGNDYYIYIIFNTTSNPELIIINNPVKNLNVIQKIEQVRFIVEYDEVKQKGEKNFGI